MQDSPPYCRCFVLSELETTVQVYVSNAVSVISRLVYLQVIHPLV